jgi:radical SAM protein with 4Fe4S-binding SPASM domain
MPLEIGNIFKDEFHSIWCNSSVLNALRDRLNFKENCRDCTDSIFYGGCRARAYNSTGDFLASDPLCSKVNQ